MKGYINICVFGDSISWGYCDCDKGGWVERLKNYFIKCGDNHIFVYNLGIESNTTLDLMSRFENELKRRIYFEDVEDWGYSPFIIFAIGKNDSLFNGDRNNTWVDIKKFEANLNELARKTKKYTDRIIFVGLGKVDEVKTVPFEESGESYCNDNLVEYNSVIERVCSENGLEFISVAKVLDIKEDLFDGVHPNAQGHEKMFKKILHVIERMIKEDDES